MKWIGQHIYDLISRFRNDVYLEDISTGTIASGGNLGLDSNNKIVKATVSGGAGDITGVALAAGTGIDITGVTGSTSGDYEATLAVDVSDFMSNGSASRILTSSSADAMAAETYFTFRNSSNISTLGLLSNEDTGDGFTIATTTHGATTLSTVDDDATAAHFKIAADGDILLEPATGDLTMYDAVDDGNPTISLGSSATDRLLIQSIYNAGAQTFNEARFTTYTTDTASPTHAGMFSFYVHEVEKLRIQDGGTISYGNLTATGDGAMTTTLDTTASSATQGGKLRLMSDDGAAMATGHRLGVIEFKGAEDASATRSIGARIEAVARGAWDGSNNDANLEFYTTDGTTESKVLTLDADKLATFTGAATITGLTTLSGNLTFDSVALTGIQTSGESFADNDTSLMTSASIQDKIQTTLPTKRLHYIHSSCKFTGSGMTSETYVSLADSDRESTTSSNTAIPFVAPATGVLKRVLVNAGSNLSTKAWSFKLMKVPSGTTTSTTTLVATVTSDAGGAAHTNQVVDFVTNTADSNVLSFESGYSTSTQFSVGDRVLFSTQCTSGSGPSGSPKINYTFVFEVDDSTAY
jgi:hypothetical protein